MSNTDPTKKTKVNSGARDVASVFQISLRCLSSIIQCNTFSTSSFIIDNVLLSLYLVTQHTVYEQEEYSFSKIYMIKNRFQHR